MPTLTADHETIALELHNTQEKALFYSMRSLSTRSVLRVLTLNLKSTARISTAETAKALTVRGDAAKPAIELRSGPAISSAEAAQRFGVSDETIRKRVKAGQFIGYRDTSEKGRIRLPEWQFSTPKTVHAWVVPLISVYGDNGWALVDFLTVPRRGNVAGSTFDGQTLLQRLQAGDIQVVMAAAKRANPA